MSTKQSAIDHWNKGRNDDNNDNCPLCGSALDIRLNAHLPKCPARDDPFSGGDQT